MGYVHYYGLSKKIKEIPAEAVEMIKETVERHQDILRLDFDEDKPPVITNKEIQLNGYGEKGYETFYFSVKQTDYYCKTNERDYDRTVTKILLILFQYIPEFRLSSDGFWIYEKQANKFTKNGTVELSDYWNEALDFMKERYSVEFDWFLDISESGGHTYYRMDICRKAIKEISKEVKPRKKRNKYSKEEKAEYFKKQLQDLKDSIEDKIVDFIENSEELKRFIQFKKKHFKSYSMRNSLLIYDQCPSASYVAGYRKWQELGYTVKKGSKGIKILIPLIKKKEDKNGEEKQELYGFKAVSVFDVSQVEAGPNAQAIPELDLDIYETADMQYSTDILLQACKNFITEQCTLHIVGDNSLGDSLGMTNGKEIYLLDTGKPLDMAAILIHEFSHFYNHFKENRKELTKDLKETEAEITAMIFASYFNLNHENRFKYLAMYRKERELDRCFETALNTFDYIMSGEEGKNGLEAILESLNEEANYEPKAS